MSIEIAGTGSYLPEKRLTNADLEKMVDTSDEWIVTRTGISERRIAEATETTSTMATIAAQRALASAKMSADELSAIIVATTTPDYMFPNTASLIQRGLGTTGAFCLDISTACTGFVAAMELGFALLKGKPEFNSVMIIGAEKLSSITDWSDRNTCVLFGDGAGATILRRVADGKDTEALLSSEIHSDGEFAEILCLPASGSKNPATHETVDAHLHFIHMEGRETFKLAVNAMTETTRKVLAKAGVTKEEVKLIIPHQANIRIIQAVAKRLELAEDQVFYNIQRYGNTSAASIPICLDEAAREGRISRGDLVLFATFGSGLTWGAMLCRY